MILEISFKVIRIELRFIFTYFVLFFFYKSSSSLWSSKWMASTGFWRTLPMNDCYSYTTVQNKISTQQLSVVIIRLILSEACNRDWIFKIILKHIWQHVNNEFANALALQWWGKGSTWVKLPFMLIIYGSTKVNDDDDNYDYEKKKVTRMKMKRRL